MKQTHDALHTAREAGLLQDLLHRGKRVPRHVHRATSAKARSSGPSKGLARLRTVEALCWRHPQADHQMPSWKGKAKVGGRV